MPGKHMRLKVGILDESLAVCEVGSGWCPRCHPEKYAPHSAKHRATHSTEPKHRHPTIREAAFSQARCTGFSKAIKNRLAPKCVDSYCPRHSPDRYAEVMARHATDSL